MAEKVDGHANQITQWRRQRLDAATEVFLGPAEKRFLLIQWNVWMNTTMDVSIVIRSKNEQRFIGQVLDGVYAQRYGGLLEVLILSSGSRDHALKVARGFPVTFYSRSPEEFTFGRALNRGARIAKEEYIVYLSAHCTPVDQEWLVRLLQPIALKWSRNLAGLGPYSAPLCQRRVLAVRWRCLE